ncbi:MAG: hypothetical protein A2513_08045 [Sulfurimonas sp. RIFOXYD12_FULL_33_39]|uniref:hypothetical protein n=1 Tax=unclassified Sulfurimonas TaxID=2623549 RepID=UPI0008D29CEB|nr:MULTISPECIES: hypothetical protein [unclassified Sulfurimonas]OHE00780.1 MAG: hypothetical protein A3G74_09770 [Sulfurimonas sp. RIFCSPLOWO2_12_FULL_34_6]OHE10041.1 MAG: hypothetical protein A2513_08045 [Sulfurimonas sp. RIFOXYD12_FULL_33_39]OHE14738.1 MAG: hypothetical protein A2530_02435 [Sulfurimonas sp. RIFOXYD2_FULL_34_21]
MSGIIKYSNIVDVLPKLPEVLLNTIQSDVLEIKSIDKECKKCLDTCFTIPELKDAYYVVFSKYIDKDNHKYEKFIFLGKDGEELFNVSGLEMELYGLITCTTLDYTDAYKAFLSHSKK